LTSEKANSGSVSCQSMANGRRPSGAIADSTRLAVAQAQKGSERSLDLLNRTGHSAPVEAGRRRVGIGKGAEESGTVSGCGVWKDESGVDAQAVAV